MMKLSRLMLAVLATGMGAFLSSAQAAVIPVVDPVTGKMIGAKNIDVDGALYDVEFHLGSCAAVFTGCDENSDFSFMTSLASVDVVYQAMVALLDNVFIDSKSGNFDSDINTIFGCSSAASYICQFYAPIGFLSDGSPWVIATGNINDIDDPFLPGFGGIGAQPVFALGDNQVWARFTSQPAAEIPLPAAAPLFVAALVGAGLVRAGRRKNRIRLNETR